MAEKPKGFQRFTQEIGETLGAAFRAGLKDLQTVVLQAFPQQAVATHEEPGMPFMPPQYEVSNTTINHYEQAEAPPMAGEGKKIEMSR